MPTIGRYKIAFGWGCWFQSHRPVTVRRYLRFIWVFREAKPTDIDKKKRFPLGTPMVADGVKYHYYKAVKDIVVDIPVSRYETETLAGPESRAWGRYVEADKQAKDEVPGGEQ